DRPRSLACRGHAQGRSDPAGRRAPTRRGTRLAVAARATGPLPQERPHRLARTGAARRTQPSGAPDDRGRGLAYPAPGAHPHRRACAGQSRTRPVAYRGTAMSTRFKDHFSTHAAIYREARPEYPPALFDFLRAQAPGAELAWDAGCGNGQASVALADHFAQVVATDPSAEQLAHAQPRPNIDYRVEPAERSSLAAASTDLVCVAQALHWFDLERFHAEVRRVSKPGGIVAFWTYADCRVSPAVDACKDRLYLDLTAPYWPAERALVENGYADLAFPFEPIATPDF